MRRPLRPSARASVTLFAATSMLALGACARDGRDLAEAQDWQTTTTRPAPPTSAPPQQPGSSGVVLSSPEFAPGGITPIDLTCAGANRAPVLSWTGVPDEAVELAVALSDQTDPENPLLLWLVAGIDAGTEGLDGSAPPAGAVLSLNDYGQSGWGNPCLETLGDGVRDLQFRLYVLGTSSGVAAADPGNEAWDMVAATALDSATLLMTIDAAL